MGEIKRINLGGEQDKSVPRMQRKQVLTVKREDLIDLLSSWYPDYPLML